VALMVIQRQLGHSNLGITSIYLQDINNARDHRRRPRPPPADDPSQHIAPALTTCEGRRFSRKAAPTPPCPKRPIA
jgi:hypothetical protein